MRYILENHVVKPKILQQQALQGLKSTELPKRASELMLKCIYNVNVFLGKYFESVKQEQLAQRNKIMQQQLLGQQMQQIQSQGGAIQAGDSKQASKSSGYNIIKAGKKLVGAFSYFGGVGGGSSAQQQEPQNQLEDLIQLSVPPVA